jgi:hypothetical protein
VAAILSFTILSLTFLARPQVQGMVEEQGIKPVPKAGAYSVISPTTL